MSDPALSPAQSYQVLARKYRPQTFADLIGQETMVRTLKNAFLSDRIAHAFIMTGVRGVGKTTTARIIAKGLNCIGPDGKGQATTEPCLQCGPCVAIAEGRHVDVMEMDAASRTGVNDIREIIDAVHYRASSARYKIYIIDEIHMLSTSAFNALLKTLEEPPPHVKFIFATTEIQKLPPTVLSRCQRFDLRRIEPEVMMTHLANIAQKEQAHLADDALALITRAGEGSVRDALSLMDQAIAHGNGRTSAAEVRAMIGLADRGRTLDLFDFIMQGAAAQALAELAAQYADGADPMAILRDLAEITHWISIIKITPDAANDPTTPPDEQRRGQEMAQRLNMRGLTRMWQMLLKAIEEVKPAPNAMMAAEMAVIRLCHVAELPDPESLIRRLQNTPVQPLPNMPPQNAAPPTGPLAISGQTVLAPSPTPHAHYATFDHMLDLVREKRDLNLLVQIENHVRPVKYVHGHIEFEPAYDAPPDLAARLAQALQDWTKTRWAISVVNHGGAPTIAENRLAARTQQEQKAHENPIVRAVLLAFPGAKITAVHEQAKQPDIIPHITPDMDDDWDAVEYD